MINVPRPTILLVFSNLFDSFGLSCHRSHSYDIQSYLELQDLYAICVVDELVRPEKMVAALIVKTNIEFGSPDFLSGLKAIISLVPELSSVVHDYCALMPAPVSVESPHPLSDDQALHVLKQLWSEHQARQILGTFPRLH